MNAIIKRAWTLWASLLGLTLSPAGLAQTTTKSIGPNPDITITGRVDYVTLGASFRVSSGNTNACAVKSNSSGSSNGVFTGSASARQREVNGVGAAVSSSQRGAVQQVPAGATVRQALLYWFASKATTSAVDNRVTFTVGGTARTVTANRTWTGAFDNADMGAVADVTSLVANAPNTDMVMDDLNIQVNDENCRVATVHGGWVLYIVYEHAGLSTKKISFYDGLDYVYNNRTDVTVSGLTLPDAPTFDKVTKLTVAASEGDPAVSSGSDVLEIRAGTSGTRTPLSSTNRPAQDIYRGLVSYEDESGTETLQGGSSVTGSTSTGGVDLATFNVDRILPAGTTTINASVASNAGEQINLYSLVLMANTTNPNVRLQKTLDGTATTVATGDTVKYILKVDNQQGATEALNVVTVDTLPRGLQYTATEISHDGGTTWTALTGVTATVHPTSGVTTVTLPAIRRLDSDGRVWGGVQPIATPIGTQHVQYRISATADGQAFGTLTNTATATSGVPETAVNRVDNTGSQPVTVIRRSDLALDKAGPVAVGAGQTLTYAIRVWNNGPDAAGSVPIQDSLPAGFTVTSLTCTATGAATCGTHTFTPSSVTVTTGTLPVDSSPTNATPDGHFLTYQITGNAPNTSGQLENQATLTVPTTVADRVSTNNASARIETRIVHAVNDLAVTVDSAAQREVDVLQGDTNGGTAATTVNSVVSIQNAGGLTGLTVNSSGQLVVPAGTAPGTYLVTYLLCDQTLRTACASATVPITVTAPTPDLLLSLSGPAYATPSSTASTNPPVSAVDRFVTYDLTVTASKASVTGTTTLTTLLPAGLSWQGTYTAPTGTWQCTGIGQTIRCTTADTLAPGVPHHLTRRAVRVAEGAAAGPVFTGQSSVANALESSADADHLNTASATTRLVYATLTKSVRNVTADARDPNGTPNFGTSSAGRPGEVLEYCIVAANLGGADLKNYVLVDPLDSPGVALTTVTTDPGYGGLAIAWTRTTPQQPTATGAYSAQAGDDAGSLDSSLRVSLGTLLAGESVRVCFQTRIR